MITPLLAAVLVLSQERPSVDSATVARLLSQLKTSDSTVCALAGQALTNFGGLWGWRSLGYSGPGLSMPRPMPTPMPMPGGGGGGGIHIGMHAGSAHPDSGVV